MLHYEYLIATRLLPRIRGSIRVNPVDTAIEQCTTNKPGVPPMIV